MTTPNTPPDMRLEAALTRTGDPSDVARLAALRVVVVRLDIPFAQVLALTLKVFVAGAIIGGAAWVFLIFTGVL